MHARLSTSKRGQRGGDSCCGGLCIAAIVDENDFRPAPLPGNDSNPARRDASGPRHESDQSLIRRLPHRGRRQAHPQQVSIEAVGPVDG